MNIKKFLSKFVNQNTFLTVLVFCISLVPFLWLKNNQILLGYDNIYPINGLDFLKDRFFSWTLTQGFGFDQSGQQGTLVVHLIDSIPQFFGASTQLSQKIVFSFWFFLIILSSYIFVIRLEKFGFIKSKYLRYIFPVLYSVNFYMLQAWWVAERAKFSLVVAMPLILAIILPMIKEKLSFSKILKSSILCSLVLTVFNGGGWGGLPLYGGLIVALFCFFIFYAFTFLLSNRKKEIIHLVLFNVLFAVFFVLLNAYTLFPFLATVLGQFGSLVNAEGGIEGVLSWSRYISADTSFMNLIRLQGIPDWYNSLTHPYASEYLTNPSLIAASFIFPLLLFLAFVTGRKENEKMKLFFLFLFLVSLFLSAGSHKPLGFIFELLMEHVPGFIIFRSPIFKFGYVYWFAASFLIGIALSLVIEFISIKAQKYKGGNLIAFILPILVLLSIVLYHFPYLTGDIFNIEKTSISSRVEVPAYVHDFSKWWKSKGDRDRILLLPKMNDNWYFDQFRWNYMSLFPLLGNFGNENTVTNSVLISSAEKSFLNSFYSSINLQDFKKMDSLASMLGIKYFLVRKDFYHDLSDQETDDPLQVEAKLKNNPNIQKEAVFGEWIVYGYKEEKPFIFAINKAILAHGDISLYSSEFDQDSLILDKSSYSQASEMFSDIYIYPNCMNCKAEREDVAVTFPRPRVLADSPIYQVSKIITKVKDKLRKNKKQSVESITLRYTGATLEYAGQISELISQRKDERYVNAVSLEYVNALNVLFDNIPSIISQSQNPYKSVMVLQQYMDAESDYVSDMLSKANEGSLVVVLESINFEINKINSRLNEFYRRDNFNVKKIYKSDIPSTGDYDLMITVGSAGSLDGISAESIKMQIDGGIATPAASIDASGINFGKQYLKQGSHIFEFTVPPQKNLLRVPIVQNVVGRVCYSSLVNNFSRDKNYRLSFSVNNNFDPGFYFFVDNGEDFSPALFERFDVALGQEKRRIFTISSSNQLKKNATLLRVSFCSVDLNNKNYYEDVNQLTLIELTYPQVVFHKTENNKSTSTPSVSYHKINQTKYTVDVKGANSPFYLVFAQQFSPGWKLSMGEKAIDSKFGNVWYFDKTGDFKMELEYSPQQEVYKGLIVSVLTLFSICLYFLHKRKNTVNE